MKPVGILGGTFDPVHYGHLRPALEVLEDLELAEVRFIPCCQPPHRQPPVATPAQRLAMLELALDGQAGFVADDQELRRAGPSYTVDTLTTLRAEVGTTPLCLLLGTDAFAYLPTWHRWQVLLTLAHLVVVDRPGASPTWPDALSQLVQCHRWEHPQRLREHPAGGILFQPVTPLAISATRVRERLGQGKSPRYLVPDKVGAYIRDRGLYRPQSPFSPSEG